ncbi:MAG: hypothetical protein ACREA2_00305 [Blastocatellia bacterium]
MARAKRFYLCNLIPLWEIDDERLEVDWTQEEAVDGDVVEMKVIVKGIELNMQTPDFSVQFEINENDILLFGGLDDQVITIASQEEKDAELRSLVVIGETDPVPSDQRLKKVFVSPAAGATGSAMIRAFWQAAWQDDIAGDPEYFFDFRLKVGDRTFKERSDRELIVKRNGAAGGSLALPVVGWSREEMFAEQTVDQVALLDAPNAGKPVSFVITPDERATLLWILLIPPRNDAPAGSALVKTPWQAPRFLPLEGAGILNLKATIGGKEVKARKVEREVAERFPGQAGAIFAELRLNPGRPESKPPDPSITVAEQQRRANDLLAADQTLKAKLDPELAKWAKDKSKNLSPSDADYAYTLQEYAYGLAHNTSTSEVKQRPSGSGAIDKWKKDFRKSYLLALMIMSAGAGVKDREARANVIAIPLAEAGFITEAMNIVGIFSSREDQKFVYLDALKQAGNTTTEQLKTLLRYFTEGTGVFVSSELKEVFGFRKGKIDDVDRLLPSETKAFTQSLGANTSRRNEKLDVIANALIDAYANDPDLVLALAGFLFFSNSFRQPFAERMWREGKGYLLFKILSSAEFNEPGYDAPTLDGVTLTMAGDMPWVYENKQRFFTDFLVFLCERAAAPIPRPANLAFNILRDWLEARTEAIAGAAPKVFPGEIDRWLNLYQMTADVYFHHVDRGNVRPDLAGHIGGLVASDPNQLRMRADCDVFATYGTRFLRAMGFISIGYMGIWAMVGGGYGIGHAGALLKKGDLYYVVNNKQAYRIAVASEAEARRKLRDEILYILNDPERYEVYYAPSGAGGEMSGRILERAPETRLRDLEP